MESVSNTETRARVSHTSITHPESICDWFPAASQCFQLLKWITRTYKSHVRYPKLCFGKSRICDTFISGGWGYFRTDILEIIAVSIINGFPAVRSGFPGNFRCADAIGRSSASTEPIFASPDALESWGSLFSWQCYEMLRNITKCYEILRNVTKCYEILRNPDFVTFRNIS